MIRKKPPKIYDMLFDNYIIRLITSSTSCNYLIKVFIVVY